MPLFSTLVDDFSTGTIDTGRWPSQANVTVAGGQAKFTGNARAYIQSAPTYTAVSSGVWLRIITAPDQWPAGSHFQFGLYRDENNWYGLKIYGPGNNDWGPGAGPLISVTGGVATEAFAYYSDGGVGTFFLWNNLRHTGARFEHRGSNSPNTSASSFEQPPNPGWAPTDSMYMRFETVGLGSSALWLDNINANLALGPNSTTTPGGVVSPGGVGAPTLFEPALRPATVIDLGTVAGPTLVQPNYPAAAGTTDTDTVGAPTLAEPGTLKPDTITNTGTVGTTSAHMSSVDASSFSDTSRVGTPGIANTATGRYGDDIYGRGTYNGNRNQLAPVGVGDAERFGSEAQSGTGGPGGTGYGAGIYGNGTYSGNPMGLGPAGVIDTENVHGQGATGYGAGVYGDGVYNGSAAAPVLVGYGAGPYGADVYPGQAAPTGPALPGTLPVIQVVPNPMHILGIGPWNPVKIWRGAINYGIGRGLAPARPVMQLPGVTSKSVTLRLDGGGEATASCTYPRTDAVIVEEMATDLWWLRKDPRIGKLEMIGRFNASHNDLSRTTDGAVESSLQFQDWRIVLGNRMVLKYKDVANSESQWPAGTAVTEIMKFAVPTDTGVDLGILDEPTTLGKTTQPFHLPPYNTINDTFTALLAISEKPWEWWVDTTTDLTKAPALKFAAQRGTDRGVTLFDFGQGPSPIASWQMRRTSDNYANALYFQGSEGGIIRTNPAAIAQYGQRDAQASDNSVVFTRTAGGQIANPGVADKTLFALSDPRPTFTVVLRTGFWRGRAHIDIGDTIRLRIRLGKEDITYTYRVTELQLDIDSVGVETVTLTFGIPLASANPRSQYSPIFRLVRTLKNYTPPPGA